MCFVIRKRDVFCHWKMNLYAVNVSLKRGLLLFVMGIGYVYFHGKRDACTVMKKGMNILAWKKGCMHWHGKWMHVLSWEKGCMYSHGKRDACTVMGKGMHVLSWEKGCMH